MKEHNHIGEEYLRALEAAGDRLNAESNALLDDPAALEAWLMRNQFARSELQARVSAEQAARKPRVRRKAV